jgi:Tfp pilus assembly protein PilP
MKSGHVFRDRKFIIFAGLVLLLILVNARQWGRGSGGSQKSKGTAATQTSVASQHDPVLDADQLGTVKPEFHEEKRNIFSFFQEKQKVQAASMEQTQMTPPPAVCGNASCEAGEDPTNCPTDCQPPPPPAPVITLRYIGYMSEPGGSVAFLTDGKEVFMARVNDVVANQYRVLKITDESIELGFLNNNQSSTIRFQGNQGG